MTSSQQDMVIPVTDSEHVGMYTHILHKYSHQQPGTDEGWSLKELPLPAQ